jgi:hypothetical protein
LSPEVVDAIAQGYDLAPVEIEVRKNAEALPEFIRPERPKSISDASRPSRFRLVAVLARR